MGMITPLGKGGRKSSWLRAAAIYTAGGAASSSLVGMGLGAVGHFLRPYYPERALWGTLSITALILALRDMNLLTFALFQRRCQAPHVWFHQFDFGSALFMWGFHIGAGFVTFIVFSGFYIAVFAAIVTGNLALGAATMLAYWLGRALSVWVAPPLTDSWPIQTIMLRGADTTLFRTMSFVGLLWCAAVSARVAFQM
jgi:hypothetical protein